MNYVILDRIHHMLFPKSLDIVLLGDNANIGESPLKEDSYFNDLSRYKYIRYTSPILKPFIIIFTDTQQHREVDFLLRTTYSDKSLVATSAGFTNLDSCYGDSFSLKLESDPLDSILLKKQLGDIHV